MLYLAQVQKAEILGQTALQFLAYQTLDNTWTVIGEENTQSNWGAIANLPNPTTNTFSTGVLVLVDMSETQEILSIDNATNWVLNVIQQYLTKGITPDFLQQEAEKAEQWRQSLTLQSQELSRRALEIETRREQIQALEEKLQREKHLLEMMAAKLKSQPDRSIEF